MENKNNGGGLLVAPHSKEAEEGVLGSILLDPVTSMGRVHTLELTADAFYDRRNSALFEMLTMMLHENIPMDAITIGEYLKTKGALDKCGGYDYLVELQSTVAVAAHLEHYAKIVVEKNMLRKIIELSVWMSGEAYVSGVGSSDLLQQMSGRLVKMMDTRTSKSNKQVLDEWYQRMEDIKNGKSSNGLPLPWPDLDAMMCGLEVGLIIIGARPSAGKTTMEVNISDYLTQQGCPVARACLDMSPESLLSRSVIRESRVSLPKLKLGFAKWSELSTVKKCKDVVAKWPIHLIEDRALDGICASARMMKLKHGIQLLTVDFAQLVNSGNSTLDTNMNAWMGRVTSQLKSLAFELNIPVLLLSQLGRGNTKENRRPRLSDLRDSGNLEQNATQVILLSKAFPDDYIEYDKNTNPEPLPEDADRRILRGIIVEIAKAQNGEVGVIMMWMRPNYFRLEQASSGFSDLSEKLSVYTREAEKDAFTDEDVVCDGDDEEIED